VKKISYLITLVAALGVLVLARGEISAQTTTVTLTPELKVTSEVSLETCAQPPAGLISWWPGDGNAQDIWDHNDGMLQGNASFEPGMVGQAFSFNGVGDYIEIPNSPSLDITGAITMGAWFKSNAGSSDTGGMIMCKGRNDGYVGLTSYVLTVGGWYLNDGSVMLVLYGSYPADSYVSQLNLIVPNNQWYYIAATWDGTTTNSNNVKLYINGAFVQSWTKTTPLNSTNESLTIGSMKPTTYYHPTNGLIDEVEIYNRALSAAEIQAIYNAGSAGKCKVISVSIDIKPGSFPNTINLRSAGVVPVAILSSGKFDATQVNPETVSLAGAKVKLIGKGDKYLSHVVDINGDGLLDLLCYVTTAQFIIEPGTSVAVLEAETFDGQKIIGQDSIEIVR
jgi:hypothetical protein